MTVRPREPRTGQPQGVRTIPVVLLLAPFSLALQACASAPSGAGGPLGAAPLAPLADRIDAVLAEPPFRPRVMGRARGGRGDRPPALRAERGPPVHSRF